VTVLQGLIAAEIDARGPLDFAEYMQLALYHPEHGYYTAGPQRTGWRGHFLTSPEIDPAFGELWARAAEDLWTACGRPDRFPLIEVGPGEGGLAAALVEAADEEFARAVELHLIELNASARERQSVRLGSGTVWHDSIDDVGSVECGCIFANELLDNLPVRVVEMRDGELLECFVDHSDGALHEVFGRPRDDFPSAYLACIGVDLPEGHRVEIPVATQGEIARIAGILSKGAVIVIDYGISAHEIADRPSGTLVAYSETGVDHDVLVSPGDRDVTSHVNWTSVLDWFNGAGFKTAGPITQREVLHRLGARDLDARLRVDYDDAVASGRGRDAVAALSRRQALGALMDPGGLGGLQVVIATRGIATPGWMTG
jgi:SAM-dependent MidA family methyltransferase